MKATKLKEQLRYGVVPAMATPLEVDGVTVATTAVAPLVDFLIGKGVRGLFVGGTTGEGILLSSAQRCRLHESALEHVAGRVPVLLHVGCNTLTETIKLAQHGATLNPSALVAMTPYFYPLGDESLLTYFQALATAVFPTLFLSTTSLIWLLMALARRC